MALRLDFAAAKRSFTVVGLISNMFVNKPIVEKLWAFFMLNIVLVTCTEFYAVFFVWF